MQKIIDKSIFLVFFTSFAITSIFLFINFTYFLDYNIFAFSLFSLSLDLISLGNGDVSLKYFISYTDNATGSTGTSSETTNTDDTGRTIYKGLLKELKVHNKELNNLNDNMNSYIKKLQELKDNHDLKFFQDKAGNLSIDVPLSMSDELINDVSKRVGVIDRLYNSQLDEFKSISRIASGKSEEATKLSMTGSLAQFKPYRNSGLNTAMIYNLHITQDYSYLLKNKLVSN